jgi:hypothetical protein
MGKFIRRWFKTALRHSVGVADLVSSTVAAAGAVITHYAPQATEIWQEWAWQIPVWVLCGIVVVRLALAPYWIWQEDQEKIAIQAKQLNYDARRLGIKNRLGKAITDGRIYSDLCRRPGLDNAALMQRSDEWYAATNDFILQAFGEGESQLFQSGTGIVHIGGIEGPHKELNRGIETRLRRLNELIQRADTVSINPAFEIKE